MNNMNDKFREQFIGLRKLINSNIDAIRNLIEQAKQLDDLAKIFTNSKDDKEQKEQLEKATQAIYKSISVLIEKTNALFEEYNKMLQKL